MKKLIFLTFLIGFFSLVAIGQTDEKRKAYIFAEFTTASDSNIAFIMEPFNAVLHNENAQGYIIIYGSPQGVRERRTAIIGGFNRRDWHDGNRITFIDVPLEEVTRTEMWIVPNGAEPPVPKSKRK